LSDELSSSDRDIAEKIEKEHSQFRMATANMIIMWGIVESNMARLLDVFLGTENYTLGSVIYSTPTATEVRIKIVDAVARQLLHLGRLDPTSFSIWEKLNRTLNRLKNTRNKVVHGQLSTYTTKNIVTVRLTSQMFDHIRFRDDKAQRQIPGLSVNDVENSTSAMGKCSDHIGFLAAALRDRERDPLSSSWRQKVQQLAGDLQIGAPHKDGQTHQE
jgi:HAMP domain-containing protein